MTEEPPVEPERSALMARIKPKDTKPEKVVRRILHAMGYRFRLHSKDLPGRPDIVFKSRKKVVFVHGCFWHRHPDCPRTTTPKTRMEFWMSKFIANQKRDRRAQDELKKLGWRYLIVWECEVKDHTAFGDRLKGFLE